MAKGPDANNEADIRAVIESWAEGVRARDADGIIAHRTADFVQFSLAPPLISGPDAQNLQAWLATWQGRIDYAIRDLSLTVDGNVAFAHSLNWMSGLKVGGETSELWFRQTLGLRKVDGKWLIAHAHASVPFYMDGTYRAAVDLSP
jgi:PhnB protein